MYVKFNIMLEVNQLGQGAGIGEIALVDDKPRNATIICLEDTHFATLEKEDFIKVEGKNLRKKYAKDVEFLSKFTFLEDLTRKTKQKICYPMITQNFVLNQKLFSEGDPVKYIYFLEEGEFEVTKTHYIKNQKTDVRCEFLRLSS